MPHDYSYIMCIITFINIRISSHGISMDTLKYQHWHTHKTPTHTDTRTHNLATIHKTADDYQCHIPQSFSSRCGPPLSNTYRSTWRNIAFLISHKVWPYLQTPALTHSKPEMKHTYGHTHTHIPPPSLTHTHTHRWIQISPCHIRYTVRPQWALSLNHKIHYLFHFVIGHKGPNQRSMPHSEWINNGSNENWQMVWSWLCNIGARQK